MLDRDLAILCRVETRVFNQAIKRNSNRFPERFRFQLTEKEYKNLRSQFVTSSEDHTHGGRRYMPYAFTEQGIASNTEVKQKIFFDGQIYDAFSFIAGLIEKAQKKHRKSTEKANLD